ncbi:MAG TPA: hypothetical protein VGX92_18520 [Pyrinomonadaceae bacterium]|jgi:hypothetical protein|nr:hypothetical protein [Pyrinomonadaceae bacterium]
MKIIGAAFFLILIVALPSFSQQKQNDEPEADVSDRKDVKGFGGHLFLVKDPRGFVEEWLKPETPHIVPVSVVERGEVLGAFVLFAGCKPDTQGICNAKVDYTLYKPDGSVRDERKEQPLWDEAAPPEPNIQLSKAILVFRLEPGDSTGEYKVKAKVHDLNAEISFELETRFRLEE